MKEKLSEIARACAGQILCPPGEDLDPVITGFVTDSRAAGPGMMFVPIRGENVDGHRFIPAAFSAGASASFTDHVPGDVSGPLVLVKDCRAALQKAAGKYRERFAIPIVGVTGSVGKTTMKELLAQALCAGFKVHKTAGNANSQVGVPITIFGLTPQHTAAVVEMGVSMPGEMGRIAAVVKPTCAVMTNIGLSHIEFMKSRENTLSEKAHIADYLPEGGLLFVNGDDSFLSSLAGTRPVQRFGFGADCEWRADSLNEADKGVHFHVSGPGGESRQLFVPAVGSHNVRSALAAYAVARHLGVDGEDAARAIAAYKAPAMRQQLSTVGGVVLIDDSYNASPDSSQAAIEVLCSRPVSGKRIAVLADMLELGDYAEDGHRLVGKFAAQKGVDLLITVGDQARWIAQGFGDAARHFDSNADAAAYLLERLAPGDALLVKGSRGMHTEEIVTAVKEALSK